MLFGEIIRDQRMRMRMTQGELAALAGVSLRAIRNIELGHVRHPHGASVRRLNAVLGIEDCRPLQIGVLGTLEISGYSGQVEVGPMKLRSLLGLLALHANHAVSRSEIAETLWDDELPKSHANLVHTYIARLRRILRAALDPVSADDVIVAASGGYMLAVDEQQVDMGRSLELSKRAQQYFESDPPVALSLLSEALDCWRGPALAGLPLSVRQHPTAVDLNGQRLAVAMTYSTIALQLGTSDSIVDRLRAVAHAEPLHEGLNAALMRALAASGQRAAAVRLFMNVRNRLTDELGIEPGPAMREVHLQIINE